MARHDRNGYNVRCPLAHEVVEELRQYPLRTADATMPSFRSAAAHRPSSDEAADYDVFPELCDLGTDQIFDGDVRVLDESLFKQANVAVKFFEFPFDNPFRNVFWFASYLRFINLAFGFDKITWNVRVAHIKWMRCSNVQRDVFDELAEIFVPRHKIRFTIDLYQHSDFTLQVNVGSNDSLLCYARGFFAGTRDTLGPQNRFRLGQITAALNKSALAIHEAGIGFFAELLHQLWVDFCGCFH